MLEEMDLGGHGIRGFSYVPVLGEHLVIRGPVSRLHAEFDLWLWSGQPRASAHRVTVPGLRGLGWAQGVCPSIINGAQRLLIVSDDGDRKAGRFANYRLLLPAELQLGRIAGALQRAGHVRTG